jgi:hypothetical protein
VREGRPFVADGGLARETCIHILDEGGLLPTHGLGLVNLCEIPVGLNAVETEQYLREHSAELSPGPATNARLP